MHNYRHNCPKLNYHIEGFRRLTRFAEPTTHQDKMPSRRHGEVLGEALNDPQDNGGENGHGLGVYPEFDLKHQLVFQRLLRMLESATMHHSCQSALKLFVVCTLTMACDEQKPPSAETKELPAPSAKELPTLAPTPPPAAPAPTPEAKPKKLAADCPASDVVGFPSPDFEAAVRLKLQKPTGNVTKADLKRLRSLNLANVSLNELDICLFPYMTNLKELFLGKGEYSDLSPISGATGLESLGASRNHVSDLKPLAKLSRLDRLDLGHTQVADLAPIAGLTLISELTLDDTQVADLSPIIGMKQLERLSIQRTKVAKVPELKELKKLKFVYVTGALGDDDPMAWAPFRQAGAKVVNQ